MEEKKRKADDKVAQNIYQFIPYYRRVIKSTKRSSLIQEKTRATE